MKLNKRGDKRGLSFRHGMTGTPIHTRWLNLMSRTLCKSDIGYKKYSKRGVCDHWLKFENFYEDMGSTFKKSLTLERIDNDKGYSKENCKWATKKEQANNRGNNKLITYQGVTLTAKQWSEKKGIPYGTLLARLRKGWSLYHALETLPLSNSESGFRSSLSKKGLLYN